MHRLVFHNIRFLHPPIKFSTSFRLRFPDPRVEPGDICVLFALNDDSTHTILESLDVECISEGFEVDPIYMVSDVQSTDVDKILM